MPCEGCEKKARAYRNAAFIVYLCDRCALKTTVVSRDGFELRIRAVAVEAFTERKAA